MYATRSHPSLIYPVTLALHLAGLISDKEKPLGSPTISGSDQRVSINMAPRNPGEWDHCVVTMCLLIKTAVS